MSFFFNLNFTFYDFSSIKQRKQKNRTFNTELLFQEYLLDYANNNS